VDTPSNGARRFGRRRTDNPWRAGADLLAMLFFAGVLLFGPLVFVGLRLDRAGRPSAHQVRLVEQSNCAQLRSQLNDEEVQASSDLTGVNDEAVNLIVEQGRRLRCRPEIRPSDSD
jgi:hypothetical protein